MGDSTLVDSVVHDGLWCSFGDCHMGVYGSEVAKEFKITRQAQDEWAYRSHVRALDAIKRGRFAKEIVPVTVPDKKGTLVVAEDMGPRADTSLEKLASLRPVFVADGTVTAGNAPGLTDGATALVLMERQEAERLELPILASILASGQYSSEPKYLHTVPAYAAQAALKKANLSTKDVHLAEINEAFASVVLAWGEEYHPDWSRVNPHGGAIALGHPLGASGGRLVLTALNHLEQTQGRFGLITMCIGWGMAIATIIERL
jgi:acetyl-CoA C-acetyltransferase